MTKMPKTTAPTKSLARRRSELASLYRELAGYRAMLEVARLYGLTFDVDRLTATVAEWEQEIDDAIEAAADAGYGPEDFESLNDDERTW